MTRPLRILFAIGDMTGGGSQRQLVGILQRLDRGRFVPHLYLVTPGGELLPELPRDVPVYVFGERWEQPAWRFPGQAHWARIRDFSAVLRHEQIDLVYDRTYHMTLTTAGAVRHPVSRVSVIVTDPRLDFETNVERYRWFKRRLLRRAYHTADRVLAVSEGVRTAAIDYYSLPPAKIETHYNAFDIGPIDRRMHESLPPAEQKTPLRFEITSAGRLHPQKGFAYLIEAIRILVHERKRQQVHLRILGAGPLEAELRATVARQGLEQHVTLAGFRANPLPYFRQADLFCLSSLYEGMPNALVEAMLCRTPVLATDCKSGPREILDAGRFGRLVPPADARLLADAIEDALLNPETWRSRIEPARDHIERTFSPAAAMEPLQNLFESLVRKREA